MDSNNRWGRKNHDTRQDEVFTGTETLSSRPVDAMGRAILLATTEEAIAQLEPRANGGITEAAAKLLVSRTDVDYTEFQAYLDNSVRQPES